jgi:hypothetical protein
MGTDFIEENDRTLTILHSTGQISLVLLQSPQPQ